MFITDCVRLNYIDNSGSGALVAGPQHITAFVKPFVAGIVPFISFPRNNQSIDSGK